MEFISVRDLRSKSAEIWRKIKVQKDMVITSKGRPMAVLLQVSADSLEETLAAIRKARAMEAVEAMQSKSVKTGLDRVSLEEINAEIEAVRKRRSK